VDHFSDDGTVDDLKWAITLSKSTESFLEDHFGASGKGLHEKISSVEDHLSDNTIRHFRRIASIRNTLVHDVDVNKIDDWGKFEESLIYFMGMKSWKTSRIPDENHLDDALEL